MSADYKNSPNTINTIVLFISDGALVFMCFAIFLLTLHAAIVDLLAPTTEPERSEKVFPFAAATTPVGRVAALLVVFETFGITETGLTKSTFH